MCSSGWSTPARTSLGIAPEEMRARNFVKPEPDALSHAHRSRLRRRRFRGRDARLPEEGGPVQVSRGGRTRRGRAARSADSALRAISNAPPGARARKVRSGSIGMAISRSSSAPNPPGRATRPPMRRSSPSISTCRLSASRSCRATPIGFRPATAQADRDPSRSAR